MPLDIIRQLRRKARHLACNNLLYNWSLGGTIPEALVYAPTDSWPGSPARGMALVQGKFSIQEHILELDNPHSRSFWHPFEAGPLWLEHIHCFSWLRDLKALGGNHARQTACTLIESWITHHHRWDNLSWDPALVSRRVSNWLAAYDFYAASLGHERQEDFFDATIRQLRHLSRALPGQTSGIDLLRGLRALIYGGLAFRGQEHWLEQGLDLLQAETKKQILSDGGHISRSPAQLIDALQIFIDIRSNLLGAGYPVPEKIEHTIDRMAQAARFFRYADKGLAVFHGAQEGRRERLDTILLKSNARGRILKALPDTGFTRVTLGRSLLMMDTGNAPPNPYDEKIHASPLAFEFIYGKERIFVSCGPHLADKDWAEMLRATSAHNTLSVDYRNICEIRDNGHIGRRPRTVLAHTETGHDATLIEGTHDGYVPINGISHRRRIYMTHRGHDMRGEETLTCAVGLSKPAQIALRFHLHPKVAVSLIQDGSEALLRLGGGSGWRFYHTGGGLALEDSLYLGDTESGLRKTKQLVIYGHMQSDFAQIKWALQRENR